MIFYLRYSQYCTDFGKKAISLLFITSLIKANLLDEHILVFNLF
ncbi:hypothetical protein A1OE_1285 [Candidatus Endolissoclinum faulkneri L2]|uniref:Uncharacterized protein n=1 Tax=Candidatus Endolissoclinum faulkneri L2 TaxID=1193729 RepID=K7Z5V6_9PROT|nr:hypothetical protein A1OE_1285 [Candidatus Endolissoclinum faulkneri L2]